MVLTALLAFIALFVAALALFTHRFPRGPLTFASFFLALRAWCLLLTRGCALRGMLLLLDGRACLLRRGLGRGRPLHLFSSLLRWL
jgi:hypothetical protein